MYCRQCGTLNPDDAEFCAKCGNILKPVQPSQAAKVPTSSRGEIGTGEDVFKDYLTFRRMVTPVIIQILFWIGVVFAVIYGIWLIAVGAGNRYGGELQVLYI